MANTKISNLTQLAAASLAAADAFPVADVSVPETKYVRADGMMAGILQAGGNKIVMPNGGSFGGSDGYRQYLADGTTSAMLLSIGTSNNMTADPEARCSFFGFGPSGTGTGPNVNIHASGNLGWESRDYSSDMVQLACDNNDHFRIGASDDTIYLTTGYPNANSNIYQVRSTKKHRFFSGGTEVANINGGVLCTRAGTSSGPPLIGVGGSLFDDYADVASTHTDGTEDDLFTHLVAANTLANNGDKISGKIVIVVVGHVTATHRNHLYFGGTAFFDSSALNVTSNTTVEIDYLIMRESSTVVRCRASALPASEGAPQYTRITGLTLSSSNTLKATGIAASTNAASGDITCKMGDWLYTPAAPTRTAPLNDNPLFYYASDAGTYQLNNTTAASSNNDQVARWQDQGENALDFWQTGSGNTPLLKTNVLNGYPVIEFDGTDDYLKNYCDAVNKPITLFLVMRTLSQPTNGIFLSTKAGSDLLNINPIGQFSAFNGANLSDGTMTNNTWYTCTVVINGASSKLRLNEGTTTTGDAGSSNFLGGLCLGGRWSGTGGVYGRYQLASMVGFSGDVTGTAVETRELARARTKYNHY